MPSVRLHPLLLPLVGLTLLAACGGDDASAPPAPRCGDGTRDSGEACDDGNTAADDGCSPTCTVEACGDGTRQAGEACEGADLAGETCTSRGFASGTLACSATCGFDEAGCVAHRCGDTIVGPGEACDDGGTASDDGCSATCQLERCGDGLAQASEACDGADLHGATCATRGYASGTLACDAACGLDETACVAHRCGDMIVGPGEECDDGGMADDDGCSATCQTERCGDGIVQASEQCDDGGTAPGDGCSATCTVETGWTCSGAPSACTVPTCGNGTLDAALGEECDDGNTTVSDGCSSTCRFEITCGAGEVAVHLRARDLALAIPDGSAAGITTSLTAGDVGSVRAVRVGIGRLTHTYVGDVKLWLTSPAGTTRQLLNSSNNGGDDFQATVFADDGATTIGVDTATPLRGVYRPVDTLVRQPGVDLVNQDAAGAWTLTLVDTVGSDAGTLEDWTLVLCVDPLSTCGDGTVTGTEACDDGDAVAGDGCTACVLDECGDGIVNNGGIEECDDGNTMGGDGCEADCTLVCGGGTGARTAVEDAATGRCYLGFTAPAITWADAELACEASGGYLAVPESADENALVRSAHLVDGLWIGVTDQVAEAETSAAGFRRVTGAVIGTGYHGFSATEPNNSGNEDCGQMNGNATAWNDLPCTNTLPAYVCELDPAPCGDGVLQAALGETCDDGNRVGGDGCSATCAGETGWFCSSHTPAVGIVSECEVAGCGDGNLDAGEGCDDDGTTSGDGCSATCQVETGYTCTGTTPSVCAATCGDGRVVGSETCDDGGLLAGDGCSATCQVEAGYTCSGAPSVCAELCGDGVRTTSEECDDGNAVVGDGCSSCQFEIACAGGTTVRVRSTDVPKAIPDNSATGVTSTVTVADGTAITKVVVGIGSITQTYNDDLDIYLTSPGGTRRELSTDNGGNGDGYASVVFDDSATSAITTLDVSNAVIRGKYRPEQSLSTTSGTDFLGASPVGTWTLKVSDDVAGDTGTLGAWTLLLCVQ